jgi:hypothetical protein
LYGELPRTIKQLKKDFVKVIQFQEAPDTLKDIERKEEFKQDIIFGNSLRH